MRERENGRARGGHVKGFHACFLLEGPFFVVPTTSKRLLSRLKWDDVIPKTNEVSP